MKVYMAVGFEQCMGWTQYADRVLIFVSPLLEQFIPTLCGLIATGLFTGH